MSDVLGQLKKYKESCLDDDGYVIENEAEHLVFKAIEEIEKLNSMIKEVESEDVDDDDDYVVIECSVCLEDKAVENGTWALENGMCEKCYCAYQGG